MRQLKGFALRRPGRPRGSKSFQGAQNDFWPLEKLLSQSGFPQFSLPPRSRPERSEDAPQAAENSQKRLYVPVTRKVMANFCQIGRK